MSWYTKFEPNPIKSLSANVQKLLHQSEARKQQEFLKEVWPKVDQACGGPWVGPPNLSSIQSMVYPQVGGNGLTNQGPGNSSNSVECEQRLIRTGEARRVRSQNLSSIQSAVSLKMCRNCSTNQRPGNDENSAKRHQMQAISHLSQIWAKNWANLSSIRLAEARKRQELSRTQPKVSQARGGPLWNCLSNLSSIWSAVVWKCAGTAQRTRGQKTVGIHRSVIKS